MERLRRVYTRLDDWVWGRSRLGYAVLTGTLAAFGVLVVGLVLGDLDHYFALGIGITLAVLNYWSDPNQRDE
jgi:hypothetical protein